MSEPNPGPPRSRSDDLDVSITRPGFLADGRPSASRERTDIDAVEDVDISLPRRTTFPPTIFVAGILWLLAGGAAVALVLLFLLVQAPFSAIQILLLVGAAFFIKDGIQLMLGRFRDPLHDGFLSVGIGLFVIGRIFFEVDRHWGATVFTTLFGLVFLVPGVLVLIGRKQYLRWRSEQDY